MAWLGALAIGLSLGLLGSGGSILTVPVLVYLVGEGEKVAIAESLAIVGLIAAVGSLRYARSGRVRWRAVALFGLPGMVGSVLGASAAAYLSGSAQLILFAIVMLLAAGWMLRPPRGLRSPPNQRQAQTPPDTDPREEPPRRAAAMMRDGLAVGALTGLVGVGGGFLIVPALALLAGLPMLTAVGTSLTIIAMQSASGFLRHHQVLAERGLTVNLPLIATFAVLGVLGSLAGHHLGQRLDARLPQHQLRRGFAAFLLIMATVILVQRLELFSASGAAISFLLP
ncbi:MAG: sulfite exporter TauE/SafE family protein [Acidobacteriota bacterium]